MIKVQTIESHLYSSLDDEMTEYIIKEEISRNDIIHIQFYSAHGEDGYLYHYGKLVYEVKENV